MGNYQVNHGNNRTRQESGRRDYSNLRTGDLKYAPRSRKLYFKNTLEFRIGIRKLKPVAAN